MCKGTAKQMVTIEAPDIVGIDEEFIVKYKTTSDHSVTDWIGLYDVDTPSLPGRSKGRWVYVPAGPEGEVKFTLDTIPHATGVYQLRYHTSDSYRVLCTLPIRVVPQDEESE